MTPYQMFVNALYILYYVAIGFAFALLADSNLPTPSSRHCAVAANADTEECLLAGSIFRVQGAAFITIGIAVAHLVLGLVYALTDPNVESPRGMGKLEWYISEARPTFSAKLADVCIFAGLVLAIVGAASPPTSTTCHHHLGDIRYCGGTPVEVTLAAVTVMAVGNLFCIYDQLVTAEIIEG